MPGYLLDTQTVRFWSSTKYPQHAIVVAAASRRDGHSPLFISVITLGELNHGHAVSARHAPEQKTEYEAWRATELPHMIDLSRHAAGPYGRIRAVLFARFGPKEKQGRKFRLAELADPTTGEKLGIDENDLWLAAQAVERNLVLVTDDRMTRIREAIREVTPEFACENWAKPDA